MDTLRLLYVEDDLLLGAIFTKTLLASFAALAPHARVIIDCASSVGEALALSSGEHEHDDAIVDLRLPDGSGMQVVEHVRAIAPLTCVVVVSAYVDSDAACRAHALGAGIVPKDGKLSAAAIAKLILDGTRSAYDRAAPLLAETNEPLPDKLDETEAAIIRYTLAKCSHNKSETARALGVARQSIQARTRAAARWLPARKK